MFFRVSTLANAFKTYPEQRSCNQALRSAFRAAVAKVLENENSITRVFAKGEMKITPQNEECR